MTSVGAIFLPQLPPERLRDVARAADEAGLEELWVWEDCFRESGIATAAAALASTRWLRMGIGLLPVPLRNVALTAMEIATLARMFPDRVHVGVGHGVQDWMAQVGAQVESPMTLLREYVTAVRALLCGEQLTTSGDYIRLDRVALDWPPPSPPKIYVGAIGPRTLRLSGEAADGTILTSGTSSGRTAEKRQLVDAARRASGRDAAHPLVVFVHAATGTSAAARLEEERQRWGYESMDDIAVAGDARTVATGVQRWVDAGADTVVLQPTPDDPDPEEFVRFVAQDVGPLVTRRVARGGAG